MENKNIFLGETILRPQKEKTSGKFVEIEGEKYYRISNYHLMPDFFMSIVSDSDHWMFLSSNGSLTAGRKNRDNSLFPYYTVDKIHDYKGITGSKTLLLIDKNSKTYFWQPFSDESSKVYSISSNIYKSIYGNKVIFEEINNDLGLKFQYGWYNSDKFGLVKKSKIECIDTSLKVSILDGITNILPYGIDYPFQNEYSNLLDAYKKNERIKNSSLALFSLSSIPVDRAEPSEALKTTTVWSAGLENDYRILISENQVNDFVNGKEPRNEFDIRASRGAYLINVDLDLKKGLEHSWIIVAELNQDGTKVHNLLSFLQNGKSIEKEIQKDIQKGTENLIRLVAKADGLQIGSEALACSRHFSNTLFNVMRGGIFTRNYDIDNNDFSLFVQQTNSHVYKEWTSWIKELPKELSYPQLQKLAGKTGNSDLIRISAEYLPLTFSRRHGDPSRPWNIFSIETKNEDGSEKLNYQGNWRDIFQNWEALSLSFPQYLEGMIAKFLNASTADGYNPYRITREGIDWECPDPEDPWAYIGYWGDHQIIYLQKFLELSAGFHPGKLDDLLTRENYVYANVPYRIKAFEDIVKDPQDTIEFDSELNDRIKDMVNEMGADARFIFKADQELYKVNLAEKILVTLLTKLSNFIPEAGIWLNTQRPEWNDANNALVGSGVSMVTLYYLRRFLRFWNEFFKNSKHESIEISSEVKQFFDGIYGLFSENSELVQKGFSDADRYLFTETLGKAGSDYRSRIYSQSFSGEKLSLSRNELLKFTELSLKFIDQSIDANRRDDGLYHAYNLISFSKNTVSIRYLYEMLEGQVAVLSSGYLSGQESLGVLDALKSSKMFRADQYSYMLYPDRELPRFIEKNNIPAEKVKKSALLSTLVKDNNISILTKDDMGNFHFNGFFRNADVLEKALDELKTGKYEKLIDEEKANILDIFEEMFDHQSFTGRSGTFYGYEGLGSIYWHMVSKLLLACQESYFNAMEKGDDLSVINRIKDHYYEIKAGIGLYKSPELYGAFPTDAYSHTPANSGVKQPGMTGQVKEDYLSRMRELGLYIKNGEITFDTSLLNPDEILKTGESYLHYNYKSEKQNLDLKNGQLGYSFCQVAFIYSKSDQTKLRLTLENGKIIEYPGNVIDKEYSELIFSRSGSIQRVDFYSKDF